MLFPEAARRTVSLATDVFNPCPAPAPAPTGEAPGGANLLFALPEARCLADEIPIVIWRALLDLDVRLFFAGSLSAASAFAAAMHLGGKRVS